MSNDTSARIYDFIVGRFPAAEFTTADDIFSLGFVNSLFAAELVMFIEKTFELKIPSDELVIDNFRTVDSMTALVGRRSVSV